VMLACDIVSAAAFASVPLTAAFGLLTIAQLYVVATIGGTASVFFSTAYLVFLPSIVTSDELVEGNAKLQGSESAAQLVGPALAGGVAQLFGAALGLLADSVSFLISGGCLLAIRSREPERPGRRPGTTIRREIVAGLRFVGSDRLLRIFTLTAALANLTMTGYESILVVFLVRTVGVNSATVGVLLAAGAAGGILGALLARPLAGILGTARAAAVGVILTSPFALLIPLTAAGPRLALFALGSFIPVTGILIYNVLISTFRQIYCPPHLLGRVAATMRFVLFGTVPLGGLLGGALATAIAIRPALWILTGASLLPAIILVASPLRRMRDLPTSRDVEAVADAPS
jgi:Na+/melibiose symporter-like transporter